MLYIMRHGKTDWNAKHKLQGRTDIPLNEEGIQMAEQAKEKYKDVNFDICYCSPLVRAKQTAEIVLEGRNIPIVYDDRLMEMCFGVYEGLLCNRCLLHNDDDDVHELILPHIIYKQDFLYPSDMDKNQVLKFHRYL